MLRITMWMNMPSFYQGDLFRALADSGQVDLKVIFAKRLAKERTQLGWQEDLEGYRHSFLDGRGKMLQAMRQAWFERDRLHIVNGLWAEPAFAAALIALGLARTTFVVHAEAPDPAERRAFPKRWIRSGFGSWVASRAAGALAISSLATHYYERLGFHAENVYPFAYFKRRPSHPAFLEGPSSHREQIDVVFAGQLIRRKGIDILVEAIAPLFADCPGLTLSIIGDGADAGALREQARRLGVAARVRFEGVLSYDKIESRIAQSDLLVLPSRWDGWGMVVNEALACGVPVITSDQCGAADLIGHGVNGFVFRSEDTGDLRACLGAFLNAPERHSLLRSAAAGASSAISAEAGARYLVDCLSHLTGVSTARPSPPWMRLGAAQGVEQ